MRSPLIVRASNTFEERLRNLRLRNLREFAAFLQANVAMDDITTAIARKFLLQIKAELETNQHLVSVYPDVFYAFPKKESPKWSEEKGICVKRLTNPKEATVEAWGLVDGQPTGAHFALRV